MSIWKRIRESLAALARGAPLSAIFDGVLGRTPEHSVAFTIAVIALGAKMAKAAGLVTRDEVAAFREIFHIPPEEEREAARVYDLARTEVAGYREYATKIAAMFRERPEVLRDLLEGLIYIAAADNEYHQCEAEFLENVAAIFGIEAAEFRSMRARHFADEHDPYLVLGVDGRVDDAALREAYRALVRDLHPDRMLARGVPEEARRLAEQRLAAVNAAYELIRRERDRETV